MNYNYRDTVEFTRLPQPILVGHPDWVELYNTAWKLAARNRKCAGMYQRWYMDCAWDDRYNYQWAWDSCFMSLYCRYAAEQFPGCGSLDNFYDQQKTDGHIGMTYDMNTGAEPWPNRINPPLFAWTEWEYWRTTGDASRLSRVLPHIERLMLWIDSNRQNAPHRCRSAMDTKYAGRGESQNNYQLYYFEDCGSSGMDDSPRTPRVCEAGQHYDWIDLSSQMVLSFSCLARLHEALGNRTRAEHWRQRATALGALINAELWCERTRFYHDRTIPVNFVAHKTVAGFWPILAGFCNGERLDALVEHLRNPREFERPTPVPSLSADDLNYSPDGVYWLGGVWAPTNYMITRGLMLAGRGDLAHEIAMKYVGSMARIYSAVTPHTIWEAYSPELDRPGLTAYMRKRVKPDFVGWSGIGPIAMLIENILGIDLDAAGRQISWDIRLTEAHGIRQLPLADGVYIDMTCCARATADAPAIIQLCAGAPAAVTLCCYGRRKKVDVSPGNTMEVMV